MTCTRLLWITGTDHTLRSHPTPEHPQCGRYLIVPKRLPPVDAEEYTLLDGACEIMIGTIDECKDCAESLELDPHVDENQRPTTELTAQAKILIELSRRVGRSGERLREILETGLPPEIVANELKIMVQVSDILSRQSFLADPDQVIG